MSRISVGHHVYVVTWPTATIIKAGYSERSRWRDFEIRGAALQILVPFATLHEAFDCERDADAYLASQCPPAFSERAHAEPFLGGRGGGYLECFGYDPNMLGAMLGHMRRIMLGHCAGNAPAMLGSNARTYGRTDELTDDHSPHADQSRNASRAGGQREFDLEVAERGADAPPNSGFDSPAALEGASS